MKIPFKNASLTLLKSLKKEKTPTAILNNRAHSAEGHHNEEGKNRKKQIPTMKGNKIRKKGASFQNVFITP